MGQRVISYGGGVQSTAMIVLAVQGRVNADAAVFANVGDDSELPASLRYIREVMTPWAGERGFPVHETRRTYADGRPHPTLFQYMTQEGSRSVPIPMRMRSGAPASRTCTFKWKAEALQQWRTRLGATVDDPFTSLIGFSTDEVSRCNTSKAFPGEIIEYPLVTDLGLTRADCAQVIRLAGLPVPPKSACRFCPWTKPSAWAEIKRDDPERFQDAADLEEYLSDRSRYFGNGPLTLTDTKRPLREIGEAQTPLFAISAEGGESCDDGVCFT